MKKCKVVYLLLIAGTLLAQTWQTGPNSTFAFTRFDGEYFPGTGKVYFLGGRLGTTGTPTDGTIWSFDPVARTYATVGQAMPVPVSNYEICLLEDDYNLPDGDTYGLYIVGGRDNNGNFKRNVQVYYPVSNTAWDITSDPYPAVMTDTVPIPACGQVVDNKMYVIGGFQNARAPYVTNQTWVYDPLAPAGSRWTQLANLNVGRGYINAAVIDSFIYACGGDTFDGTSLIARTWCERFNAHNPGAGWTRIRDLPRNNGEARAFGFGAESPYGFANRIIVAGRGTWSSESAHCYIYNALTDSWATFPSLNQRRRDHAGAFIPGNQNNNGIPGIWVWGGRQDSDNNVLIITEFYQFTLTGIAEPAVGKPSELALSAEPNPFRRATAFRFNLAQSGRASIRVYAANGELVWTSPKQEYSPGSHVTLWNGTTNTGHVSGRGIYFCRLDAENCGAGLKLTKLD